MAPVIKAFLKCPCCGRNSPHEVFESGIRGYPWEALTQAFVGRGHGTNGGGTIWDRRPMTWSEAEFVSTAIDRAAENFRGQKWADIAFVRDALTRDDLRLRAHQYIVDAERMVNEALSELEFRKKEVEKLIR